MKRAGCFATGLFVEHVLRVDRLTEIEQANLSAVPYLNTLQSEGENRFDLPVRGPCHEKQKPLSHIKISGRFSAGLLVSCPGCGGYYARSPQRDPEGPASGQLRVIRGSPWVRVPPSAARAADRFNHLPLYADHFLGFRCVHQP